MKTKTSILLKSTMALLFIVVLSFTAKSQNYRISITNITGCNYTVQAMDVFNLPVNPSFTAGAGFTSPGCQSGPIDHIDVMVGGCTITFTIASLPQSFPNCSCSLNNANCSLVTNAACGPSTLEITMNLN